MDNELGILLAGSIDVDKTIQQINTDLASIAKRVKALNLNIDTSGMTKDIERQIKDVENKVSNINKSNGGLNNLVSVDIDKLRKNNAEAFKEIDKLTKHYNSSLTSLTKTGGIDLTSNDDIEKLNRINIAMKDLEGVTRRFQIANTEDGFQVVTFDELHNIEKATKETEKLANAMGKGRENSLLRQQQEQQKALEAQNKAINKNIEDTRKQQQSEQKKTEELQHQLQLAQRQAAINVQNLRRRYDPVITPEQNKQLDDYVQKMNNLTATPTMRKDIQNIGLDFKEVSANIAETGSHAESFGSQLATAMARIPIWIKFPIVQYKLL